MTCTQGSGAILDYMVHSASATPLFTEFELDTKVPWAPHYGFRFTLARKPSRIFARIMCKPAPAKWWTRSQQTAQQKKSSEASNHHPTHSGEGCHCPFGRSTLLGYRAPASAASPAVTGQPLLRNTRTALHCLGMERRNWRKQLSRR